MNVLKGICYVVGTIGILFIGLVGFFNAAFTYTANEEQINQYIVRHSIHEND